MTVLGVDVSQLILAGVIISSTLSTSCSKYFSPLNSDFSNLSIIIDISHIMEQARLGNYLAWGVQ